MPMNRFTNLSDNEKLREVIRFGDSSFYRIMQPTLANTTSYSVSFAFNYVASTRYTFKVKSTTRRGLGFAFSHLVNYTMQTVVLATMLFVGIPKDWAMVPVFAICVPVNFILVRYFLKK